MKNILMNVIIQILYMYFNENSLKSNLKKNVSFFCHHCRLQNTYTIQKKSPRQNRKSISYANFATGSKASRPFEIIIHDRAYVGAHSVFIVTPDKCVLLFILMINPIIVIMQIMMSYNLIRIEEDSHLVHRFDNVTTNSLFKQN